ncbi:MULTISPECIES: hypothetical protein [unclassified Streptomyces]|uniref:hypothetical protein n=1 Tax=unclassified Streptomyces TaxID=2593676 RepID=UPI0015A552D8|nr:MULTISPECIES: hypothetical protein [unclassified Streptomyces]
MTGPLSNARAYGEGKAPVTDRPACPRGPVAGPPGQARGPVADPLPHVHDHAREAR